MNESTAAVAADTQAPAVAPDTIVEHHDLCDGKRVHLREAEAALAELGDGWRLETLHEAFNAIDYDHKNQHGALSRDEDRTPDPYWTSQPYPLDPSARVVVWFDDGYVGGGHADGGRARARAVRVAGQSSDI